MYPLGATVSEQPARPRCWGARPGPLRPAPRLSIRTPSARSRVESCPGGQRRPRPPSPAPLQSTRTGLQRKAHVNYSLPRFHTNSRASPPSCALPKRAIHAARDGHRHGPVRPGPAARACGAAGKPWLSPAGPIRQDHRDWGEGRLRGPGRPEVEARGGRVPAGQRQSVQTVRQAV